MCPNDPKQPVASGSLSDFQQLVQDHAIRPGKWGSKEALRLGSEDDAPQQRIIYPNQKQESPKQRTSAQRAEPVEAAKTKSFAEILASIWRRFKERCSGIKTDNKDDAIQVKKKLKKHLGLRYKHLLPQIYYQVRFVHGRNATQRVSRGDLFLLGDTAEKMIKGAKTQEKNQRKNDERVEAVKGTIELYIASLSVVAGKEELQEIPTSQNMLETDKNRISVDNVVRKGMLQSEAKVCREKVKTLQQLMRDVEDASTYMYPAAVEKLAKEKIDALGLDEHGLTLAFGDTCDRMHRAILKQDKTRPLRQHQLRLGLEVVRSKLKKNAEIIGKRLDDFTKNYHSAKLSVPYYEFGWIDEAKAEKDKAGKDKAEKDKAGKDKAGKDKAGKDKERVNRSQSKHSYAKLREEAEALEALFIHIHDEALPALDTYRSQLVKTDLEDYDGVEAFQAEIVRKICAPTDAKINEAKAGLSKLHREDETFWDSTSEELLKSSLSNILKGERYHGLGKEVERLTDLFEKMRRDKDGNYRVKV